MIDENDTPEAKEILAIERTNYFKIGLSLTAVILLLAATYVFVEFEALYKLKPNEFGDFLAGIFGPLVLLWVVMGFLQQGAELKYSREALLLQAKELKASVEAQKDMGAAAWAGVHLERDALQQAELNRSTSLRPILTLIRFNRVTSRFIADVGFTLANSGGGIVDINLNIFDENLSVEPCRGLKLASGEEIEFRIKFVDPQFLTDCVLKVNYKDVQGRPYAWQFELKKVSGGWDVQDSLGESCPVQPLDLRQNPR